MFYPKTITELKKLLYQKDPALLPIEEISNKMSYLLWMLEQIKQMSDPLKAARWIGYCARLAEEINLLDNNRTRELIRSDVGDGNQ